MVPATKAQRLLLGIGWVMPLAFLSDQPTNLGTHRIPKACRKLPRRKAKNGARMPSSACSLLLDPRADEGIRAPMRSRLRVRNGCLEPYHSVAPALRAHRAPWGASQSANSRTAGIDEQGPGRIAPGALAIAAAHNDGCCSAGSRKACAALGGPQFLDFLT